MLHDASSIFTNGPGFGRAPGFIILLSKEISFWEGNIFLDIILQRIKRERNVELHLPIYTGVHRASQSCAAGF